MDSVISHIIEIDKLQIDEWYTLLKKHRVSVIFINNPLTCLLFIHCCSGKVHVGLVIYLAACTHNQHISSVKKKCNLQNGTQILLHEIKNFKRSEFERSWINEMKWDRVSLWEIQNLVILKFEPLSPVYKPLVLCLASFLEKKILKTMNNWILVAKLLNDLTFDSTFLIIYVSSLNRYMI